VGSAIAAMKDALKEGIAGNLAGGTHHSHADRGEGYCVFDEGVFIFSMHGDLNSSTRNGVI
jgi:acetoin utilization deacetylase AcuC-like enzyme